MKRIFITGIAGFIGFHLALALKKRGDCVIGCDNFNPYYDITLKHKRAKLLKKEGIEVLTADLLDKELITEKLSTFNPTHVAHLAAQAGVRYSLTHPESYVHSNLQGFVAMLEQMRLRPGIPFIYASSSSVYGLNQKVPFAEHDPTEEPASFYAATKKSNELIAHSYHHLYGIPCTGLRYFTVYGPWGRPDMAYFSFTKAILEGTPLTLFGEGKLKRDFTYIDDIIEGTISAIDLSAPLEIFNLGNHKPHSVLELIETLEKLLGKEAIKQFSPLPPGDVEVTFADISKSKRLLNYEPKTSLAVGLERFTHWYTQIT